LQPLAKTRRFVILCGSHKARSACPAGSVE